MNYELDPELIDVMAALAERGAAGPAPARDDWKALREKAEAGQAFMAGLVPVSAGVERRQYLTRTSDGASVELRWYTKDPTRTEPLGPTVVYSHGGGAVAGTLDLYDEVISWYVGQTGVPFLSVGYRRAPDEGHSTMLAEDVYSGLAWLIDHAAELGVDPGRIAVMGDSGGGGPAAGAAILARERNVNLARQILVYPMLDDRNQTADPDRAPFLTWTYDDNYTAWHAVLGDQFGTGDVSPVAAPARLTDFAGLAPAYLEVGDLDIFRDETIAYAARLATAGVPIELHVHPGAPHGWERFAPKSDSAQRAMNDRARAISTF
ncbi:MAG: alpha/beta hydrolase [Trebonia sp.]